MEETINRAVQGEHARTHRKRQGAEQYQQNAANNERNRQTRDRLAALTAEEAPDTASEEAERARIFAREAALTVEPSLTAGPEGWWSVGS